MNAEHCSLCERLNPWIGWSLCARVVSLSGRWTSAFDGDGPATGTVRPPPAARPRCHLAACHWLTNPLSLLKCLSLIAAVVPVSRPVCLHTAAATAIRFDFECGWLSGLLRVSLCARCRRHAHKSTRERRAAVHGGVRVRALRRWTRRESSCSLQLTSRRVELGQRHTRTTGNGDAAAAA